MSTYFNILLWNVFEIFQSRGILYWTLGYPSPNFYNCHSLLMFVIFNFLNLFCKCLFIFERERVYVCEWGRVRERGKQDLKRTDSREPHVGLKLRNHKIMIWAQVRCLTNWAVQLVIFRRNVFGNYIVLILLSHELLFPMTNLLFILNLVLKPI